MGYKKIVNLYQDPDIIHIFKEVYCLEKIHGCLQAATRITLADGTKIPISKLVRNRCIGTEVLGFKNGKVTTTKIVNVFVNGKTDHWLKISGKRKGAGRGHSRFVVRCTPEHKIYNGSKYIPAEHLKKGDSIFVLRKDLEITPLQEQVLLGMVLGDASIKLSTLTASIYFGHKEAHKEYCDWIAAALGDIVITRSKLVKSGYGTMMQRASTTSLFAIKEKFESFIKNGRKVVPDWVVKAISPVGLAFWYMDDGSLGTDDKQEDRALFATCDFTEKDCKTLLKCLSKFNIKGTIQKSDGYLRIRLNADEADKFFALIAPYIPKDMQYKLPKRYRGAPGWLPNLNSENCYKKHLVEQEILSIEKIDLEQLPSRNKYDIETETHNFFANDILVHNSSARVSWKKGKLHFFSGGAKHSNFIEIFDHNALIKKFKDNFEPYMSISVYGEVYGGKMQGMSKTYGPDLKFVAFEVCIDDNWLNVPNAENVTNKLGLEFVHYVKGPSTIEFVNEQRDAPSVQAIRNGITEPKKREGVVIRPMIELTKNNGSRIMAKHKHDDFRETKTPREISPETLKVLADAKEIADEWATPMRLTHVIDKLCPGGVELTVRDTSRVISAMIQDIRDESAGEIAWSPEVSKALGRQTAVLFQTRLKSKLTE